MSENLETLKDFGESRAKPSSEEKILHDKLHSLFLLLDGLTEKLHASIPPEEKKEEKVVFNTKEKEKGRENDGDNYEEEEEEEDDDDVEDYLEGKRFTGGRKNEFGGGKTQRSKDKWG
jgi:hypothetical protein